jgi:pimeloyl-ACP methyl ester carboxylesterase
MTLAYQEFHPEKETTLLFLHGGGAAGWMWQPVIEHMPEYHCLVPDLPEHGESAGVKPFSMLLAAEKCAELVRLRAHEGKAVVVGLSEGAQVAVQMLASAPDCIDRAMISSALLLPMPGAKMVSSPRLLAAAFRWSIPPFRNVDWWIRLNMKYAAGIPEAFYLKFKSNFQTMTEGQFVNLMVANQTFRLPAELEKVQAQVMVICGKHEYHAIQESALLLKSVLPHANSYNVDLGKGSSLTKEHNWAMTAPQLFAETLKSWLADRALPEELSLLN